MVSALTPGGDLALVAGRIPRLLSGLWYLRGGLLTPQHDNLLYALVWSTQNDVVVIEKKFLESVIE
jgi:hypothetical protein